MSTTVGKVFYIRDGSKQKNYLVEPITVYYHTVILELYSEHETPEYDTAETASHFSTAVVVLRANLLLGVAYCSSKGTFSQVLKVAVFGRVCVVEQVFEPL